MLLVVSCANVAALLLGEAAGRENEVRLRLALGARPSRIVGQLVIETGVLSVAGAATGLPLALMLTRGLVMLAPFNLPRAGGIAPDWRALVLAIALTAGCALACGLAPAVSLLRSHPSARPGGQRTATPGRRIAQHALIGMQTALSVVLVIATGLLVRTLAIEQRVPIGFDADRLLTVSMTRAPQDFYDRLVEQARLLPGVLAVTTTSNLPIAGRGGQWSVGLEPDLTLSLSSPSAQHDEVLPNFFEMMRIPVRAGRALDASDTREIPTAAVVNETMARALWPRTSALGQRFRAPNGGIRTVVGIAADVREAGLARPAVPTFYDSIRQVPASSQALIIRTDGDPRALVPSIRRVIASINPSLPIGPIDTMDDIVRRSLAPERFRVLLGGFFAAAALGMTMVGLFGVALRAVTAQMREVCVRLALGASAGSVIGLVVRRHMRAGTAGLAAGVVLALFAARWLRAYLSA